MSSSAATPESAPSQDPAAAPPKKEKRSLLFRVVRVALLAYLGLCAVLFFMQRAMLFPGAGVPWCTPEARDWPFEEFRLPVDGETTHGWYIPVENARGTVLFSHGNAANMANDLSTAGVFRTLGFNVVQYAYGGFGYSTGKPSEKRCYADARAVWKWLTEQKGEPPNRVVIVGRSLGGAMAAQLATEETPAAVILESTFTCTADVALEMFPYLPVRPLTRDKFQTVDKLANIHAPILIIHSPDDTVINYRFGRKLFERANEPKTFLELRGDHNDGYDLDSNNYIAGLKRFFGTVFKPADGAKP